MNAKATSLSGEAVFLGFGQAEDYKGKDFSGENLKVYSVNFPMLNRVLEIVFQNGIYCLWGHVMVAIDAVRHCICTRNYQELQVRTFDVYVFL